MRSLTTRVTVVSIGVLLACLPLLAQTYTGRILGVVTDQTGAALAGAQVVVTDMQRGVSRTLTTDQAGEYVAPDLSPGKYKVHAEAKGFKAVEQAEHPSGSGQGCQDRPYASARPGKRNRGGERRSSAAGYDLIHSGWNSEQSRPSTTCR